MIVSSSNFIELSIPFSDWWDTLFFYFSLYNQPKVSSHFSLFQSYYSDLATMELAWFNSEQYNPSCVIDDNLWCASKKLHVSPYVYSQITFRFILVFVDIFVPCPIGFLVKWRITIILILILIWQWNDLNNRFFEIVGLLPYFKHFFFLLFLLSSVFKHMSLNSHCFLLGGVICSPLSLYNKDFLKEHETWKKKRVALVVWCLGWRSYEGNWIIMIW